MYRDTAKTNFMILDIPADDSSGISQKNDEWAKIPPQTQLAVSLSQERLTASYRKRLI